MTAPEPDHETVTYQVPRNELVRIIFRRMLVSRRRIRGTALFLVAAALFYFSYPQLRVLSYAIVGVVLLSEMSWSMFKGFSEDASYFYLHLSDTGFDSVLPKSAFTPPQQELFRKLASRRKA